MRASPLRRSSLLAALLGSALLSLSCGGDSGSPSPTPSNIVVTPGADTLISIGATRTFTASVLDANGDPIDGKTVTWSSTAPGTLSIDATTGVATAVANGSAQVTATAGTLQGSANVVVVQIVASVTVTPGNVAFTAVGDTARFTAVAKDGGGTPVVGVQILWSVSDNTVATIDTLGLAKSKGPGTALVSAQAQTHAGYAALGVDPSVTQFVILAHPDTGTAGEPLPAALQVELRDARGNRVMNSSLAVTVSPAGAAIFSTLHGATSILADQGRATFTNLWFERAGADRLMVTVAALPADSTTLVGVAPAAPSVVHLDSLAPVQTAGVPIGLVARVYDRFGNLATNYGGWVQAELAQAPSGGTMFGAALTVPIGGVATFADLNLHRATGPWRFTAFLPGVAASRDTSSALQVTAGPAASFAVTHLGKVAVGFSFGDSTVIQVADAFGNLANADSLGDTLVVDMSVGVWPYFSQPGYGQRIIGQFDAQLSGGHATFNIGLSRPGHTSLVFSMPGFIPDTTAVVTPVLPTQSLFNASSTVQAAVLMGDRFTCLGGFLTLCSGVNDHGVLGVDSNLVGQDSLWLLSDSTFGGDPIAGDGGDHHVCLSVSDFYTGTFKVDCWGDNTYGQLGGGTVGGESSFPVTAIGVTATTQMEIAAGGAHTCALFDGVAECWGRNDQGQLGIGSAGAPVGTPTPVAGGHIFTVIAAGGRHTCGIDDSGLLWCWGANDFGQLGDSGVSGAYSATPVSVMPGKTWVDVTAGDDFTCASLPDFNIHYVYCWGRNDHLQLGPNHTSDSLSAVPVVAQTLAGNRYAVRAGAAFVCAVSTSAPAGQGIMCWGANGSAQLGRGTVSTAESDAAAPSAVAGGVELGWVIPGRSHVCALTNEDQRRLVCWGDNSYGQLGIGHAGGQLTSPVLLDDEY